MAKVSSDRSSLLRNRIFKVLNKHKASPDNALKALSQCHTHINDRLLIEEIAKESGLKLSGFQTNERLELYYDLKHGRQDVCFLSKGWDDPGFRLGEIVDIPKWKLADMREHVYALLKFCATQGVAMTIEETEDALNLQFDFAIYSEGFNKQVFERALHSLDKCVEKAQDLIG
jgi:hypothetical protein